MLFNTFLGCLTLLITNISLVYVSYLFVRRFLTDASISVRLVAIGLLFYAFILLILQALSPFHAISRFWVSCFCFLLAVLFHFTWGKLSNLRGDFELIKSFVSNSFTSWLMIPVAVCGFVVLLSLSRALLMPPLTWDCLSYYLAFSALWVQKGTILFFKAPDEIIMTAHYPINGELFATWFLLPFRNDLLVNTMNFPITLLGGISCYAISRELGATRKVASLAPALICFTPMIYKQLTDQTVDTIAFAFCSASVLFALRYIQRGNLSDGVLSLVGAGILLGTKLTGVPIAGVTFFAFSLKTVVQRKPSALLNKVSLMLAGLLIIGALGGRQYVLNFIRAENPFYPYSLTIFGQELCEGWSKMEELTQLISADEQKKGLDKFNWWERESRKFVSIGPKFLPFFILALISLVILPKGVPKRTWYFLSAVWLLPIVLFYGNPSTAFLRSGFTPGGSVRYLLPSAALFTVQALVLLRSIGTSFKIIYFFLIAFVAWDLLQVDTTHIAEVEELYPLLAALLPGLSIFFIFIAKRFTRFIHRTGDVCPSSRSLRIRTPHIKLWGLCAVAFIFLVVGLYFLQAYRNNTRYAYYVNYTENMFFFPKKLVEAWEYFDTPDERKTIAMTTSWPRGRWFFYPLLGRWLQNDITYISAKHKEEVLTWFDKGLLRGDNFSIWFQNIKKKQVDYIFLVEPWPIELEWIKKYQEHFQLVFNDTSCKIYRCTLERTLDQVIAEYKQAVASSPDKLQAHIDFAVFYFNKGMLDEAIAAYKEAIAIDPNHAEAHNNLAVTYDKKGMADEAIAAYKEAIAINPNHAETHNNLAVAYDKKGMVNEAISAYKKAIAINPNLAEAHNQLGRAYEKKWMLDEAIDEYQKAIAINPQLGQMRENLKRVYRLQKTADMNIAKYKKALQANPDDPKVLLNLGSAYATKGEWHLAITAYEKALTLYPDYAAAYNNLGGVYFAQGKNDTAITAYEKALALKPDYGQAHFNLSVAYFNKGNYGLAITHCDKAQELGIKVSSKFLLGLQPYR